MNKNLYNLSRVYLDEAWQTEIKYIGLRVAPIELNSNNEKRWLPGEQEWIAEISKIEKYDKERIKQMEKKAPTQRCKEALENILNEIDKKALELMEKESTLTLLIKGTEKVVFRRGRPMFVEIYLFGRKLVLEDKDLLTPKMFQLLFYREFLKLIKFKKTEWDEYFKYIHENEGLKRITIEEDPFVYEENETRDEFINIIQNLTFVDNISDIFRGTRYGYFEKQSGEIYIPDILIKEFVNRKEISVEKLRLIIAEFLSGKSMRKMVDGRYRRIWRLRADMFDLSGKNIYSMSEEQETSTSHQELEQNGHSKVENQIQEEIKAPQNNNEVILDENT